MHEYVLPCTQTYHVGFFYGHGSKAMEHVRHNNEAKCMGHLNHGLKTMDRARLTKIPLEGVSVTTVIING